MDDPSPARSSAMPSLLGRDADRPAQGSESISILSAVTPPPVPPQQRASVALSKHLPLLGALLLMVLVVALWQLWGEREPDAATAAAVKPRAPLAPALSVATPSPPTPAEPPASIELDTESTASTPSSRSMRAMLEPAPAATRTAPAPPPREAAKAQRSPFAAIEPASTSRRANDTARPAPRAAAPPAATDVDLLAALLTHNEVNPAGKAKAPVEKPTARPKLSTSLSSLELKGGTQEQLNRCEQMAQQDKSRCKARICAGLWGRDSACPKGSEPPARGAIP